jgi:hypothetical protein
VWLQLWWASSLFSVALCAKLMPVFLLAATTACCQIDRLAFAGSGRHACQLFDAYRQTSRATVTVC